MTDSSVEVDTEQLPQTPPDAAALQRDEQRAALRELIALSAECAAREAAIEKKLAEGKSSAEQALRDSSWESEQRLKSTSEETVAEHQRRLAHMAQQFKAACDKLTAADKATRHKVEVERETIEQKLKKEFDQAVWLADSVFDLAQNQIRDAYKKAEEESAERLDQLNSMEIRAANLLQQYGVPLPQMAVTVNTEEAVGQDAEAAFKAHLETAGHWIVKLSRMPLAGLFVGAAPYLLALLLCAVAAVVTQWQMGTSIPQWKQIGIAVGCTLGGLIVIGIVLRVVATRQVREVYKPLRQTIAAARVAAEVVLENAAKKRDLDHGRALTTQKAEVEAAQAVLTPSLAKINQNRDSLIRAAEGEFNKHLTRLQKQRDHIHTETNNWKEQKLTAASAAHEASVQQAHQKHATDMKRHQEGYAKAKMELEAHWNTCLKRLATPMEESEASVVNLPDWQDRRWENWTPPKVFAQRVRFGELRVDLEQIAETVPKHLKLPPRFSLQALLAFPRHASLLVHTDHTGRAQAIRTLQMMMARLLTSLPAGRVRFTIIDPVGLGQNFAGFMHLADYDDALVGGRIWTAQDHIDQRLTDLTEHMETVIQKYLRNEFLTIDDYNAQAGELSEPYRFLVISDFPAGFSQEAARKLTSIATTGARCGVYCLVIRDTRAALPGGWRLDELEAHSVNLVQQDDRFVWKDEVFSKLPLELDEPPSEEMLTKLMHVVGQAALESKRVEVSFSTIAPGKEQYWTGDCTSELTVPIGRLGATRLQYLRLGRGVAQHMLIAGKTGSGKSTLLHAMVTNVAMWYSPDQVELYLIDFKKGVEFKTYATHALPHARAIAIESDREFGLSVLQRLDAELARRGELFRKAGVQDLPSYRHSGGALTIPRTLLVVDEFQELFSEDDRLAQESSLLLDRLVRQGRAFGIHVLLGSQTLGGVGGLARSTFGQMAVRVALQCSEADSQLILGDNNSAARLLSRPGEAIYNDQGGLVEANSPFQVAWLPDEQREEYLIDIRQRAAAAGNQHDPAIVFEGNIAADISRNGALQRALSATQEPPMPSAPQMWIGEPVAIKDPSAIVLRRQSGANVLIVGQQEESALATMIAGMISLAAQHPADGAAFHVLDGTPADSSLCGQLAAAGTALPQKFNLVEWRAVPEMIGQLHAEMQRRQAGEQAAPPGIFLLIYGMQRYRVLRKQEDDFSFSSSDEDKKPSTGKQFAELLREGPPLGIHIIAWSDTLTAVDRTVDRGSMREFDHRILFQMSANDSSNLIDSPLANRLGFYRAIAFSEEQGVMEKFRPYALPGRGWLDTVKQQMAGRTKGNGG